MKVEQIDHDHDLFKNRHAAVPLRQHPHPIRRLRQPADLDENPFLETASRDVVNQQLKFLLSRELPDAIVRAAHGAAETAQRPRIEIQVAGLLHQERKMTARMLRDEMMQERGFSRAEKSGDQRDGQADEACATLEAHAPRLNPIRLRGRSAGRRGRPGRSSPE